MHVKRAVTVHAQRKVVEVERTIGLDKARGKLGQLAEEVRAENAPVVLMPGKPSGLAGSSSCAAGRARRRVPGISASFPYRAGKESLGRSLA